MTRMQDVARNTITAKTRTVITKFRDEMSKNPEAQAFIELDFSSPCQAEVVWLCNKFHRMDTQLIVFTHFHNLPDLDIRVWGPFPPTQASRFFRRIVEDPKWKRELPAPDNHSTELFRKRWGFPTTWALLLEELFVVLWQVYKGQALKNSLSAGLRRHTGHYKQELISRNDFCWTYEGDIRYFDIDSHVAKMIEDVQSAIIDSEDSESISEEFLDNWFEEYEIEEYGPAWATYFDPPIWVGEIPVETLARLPQFHIWESLSSNSKLTLHFVNFHPLGQD